MRETKFKPLTWVLAAVFVLSMLMGTGPGILLVNRPDTVWGIPLVYAWGIFWYVVQVAVALIAYFVVWARDTEEGSSAQPETREGDQT